MPTITLRPVAPSDLETLYLYQRDPDSNHMAAFVGKEPRDRPAFQAHWDKILASPQNTNRTILAHGQIAGHVACYPSEGHLEVTYWLGKDYWGQGIATEALRRMLAIVRERPLFGRAAADNTGSIRVLQKCGFRIIGQDRGFAPRRGQEIEEQILRLDSEDPAQS